jgi:serine/threonine protein phosphatase PrpC
VSGDHHSDSNPHLPPPWRQAAPPRPFVRVDVGGRTHAGKVRPNNEDNFHVVQFGRYLRPMLSSLPGDEIPEEDDCAGYVFVVADGVGGHSAGEIASRRAIALFFEYALQTPDWILGREDALLETVMDRTESRFRSVSSAIRAQAQGLPALSGMATTLSLALSLGDDLIVAHVGDSPVCLFRDGQLHRLTRDHTVPKLAGFDADAARFRNVLTRAIGATGVGCEPDVERYQLADGDRLLLCTDGLTNMVDDGPMACELGRGTPSADVCQALVDLALDQGGKDNVTVVVATYRFLNKP